MVAAMAVDLAALLELTAPVLMHASPGSILPLACAANVLKNIGFLAASASRAALHQSLALAGNLADVTAKSGSQSMAAGLLGTAAGIGLSSILGHDPTHFLWGFCGLAAIHQGCNYVSLKAVSLRHFNRQRLSTVLEYYVRSDKVLSPGQVAAKERFLPFVDEGFLNKLSIGSPLLTICPAGSDQLARLLGAAGFAQENYLVNLDIEGSIYLVFFENASGEDVILGMLHATLLNDKIQSDDELPLAEPIDLIASTHQQAQETFPRLLNSLHEVGWNTGTDVTIIEPRGACRLALLQREGR
jgi:hypothetical protein